MLCVYACGGAVTSPAKPAVKPRPAAVATAAAAPAPASTPVSAPAPTAEPAPLDPPPDPPPTKPAIKGLTGTLNTDDVHQRMEAQQPAFDACIQRCRRGLRWVSGAMRFAFKVDAEGHILDVHPVESSIGHRELEQCLTEAVSEVVFPKPAGRATAQFAWSVTVEPATTPADPLDAASVEPVLRKQRRTIARNCELRRRERFVLTVYVAPNGKVISLGGFAQPARAADKVDCVLEAVGDLRLPKVPRRSKVSFRL